MQVPPGLDLNMAPMSISTLERVDQHTTGMSAQWAKKVLIAILAISNNDVHAGIQEFLAMVAETVLERSGDRYKSIHVRMVCFRSKMHWGVLALQKTRFIINC